MTTFYIEGERPEDYMLVEGMTASEATCYFDTFYGSEPRHLRRVVEGSVLERKHRTFTVSIPVNTKIRIRKEGENE